MEVGTTSRQRRSQINMTLLERAQQVLNSTDCLYSAEHYKRIIRELLVDLAQARNERPTEHPAKEK